jgi:hypothetical protein
LAIDATTTRLRNFCQIGTPPPEMVAAVKEAAAEKPVA